MESPASSAKRCTRTKSSHACTPRWHRTSTETQAPPGSAKEKPPALLSRDEIEQRIRHALAAADDQPSTVCALMFGIVNHNGLSDQFGQEVAAELGAHFARRVCQSLASGRITVRGQKIKLSATAGAASAQEAEVTSSQGLLALASQRLDRALACGGNAVVIDSRPECPLHHAGLLLPAMLAALNASDDKAIVARIGTFGLQILPLLKALNQELALGLSLPEIQRQLQQRAQAENGTTSGTASSEQTL